MSQHEVIDMQRTPVPLSIIGFALMALIGAQSALAVEDEDIHFDTTEDLFQVCSVPPDAAEHVVASFACRGFIEGAVQYHDAVSDRRNLKRLICYPKTATVEDGRAAFVAWARPRVGDAALMEELPVVGLVRALAAKYPCQ
jgi:hypothetical protein